MSQPKLTHTAIQYILDQIKFQDRKFRLLSKGDGYLLQLQYHEPDVDKPVGSLPELQSSRKWYISPYMTPSEVVETAWACVCRSQLHIASEHFTYKGRRIYSQHFYADIRVQMCDDYAFDSRSPRHE